MITVYILHCYSSLECVDVSSSPSLLSGWPAMDDVTQCNWSWRRLSFLHYHPNAALHLPSDCWENTYNWRALSSLIPRRKTFVCVPFITLPAASARAGKRRFRRQLPTGTRTVSWSRTKEVSPDPRRRRVGDPVSQARQKRVSGLCPCQMQRQTKRVFRTALGCCCKGR